MHNENNLQNQYYFYSSWFIKTQNVGFPSVLLYQLIGAVYKLQSEISNPLLTLHFPMALLLLMKDIGVCKDYHEWSLGVCFVWLYHPFFFITAAWLSVFKCHIFKTMAFIYFILRLSAIYYFTILYRSNIIFWHAYMMCNLHVKKAIQYAIELSLLLAWVNWE